MSDYINSAHSSYYDPKMNRVPEVYQPGSTLRFKIDEDTLTATIVHVFLPFTYSQVVVVRTSYAYTVGHVYLPEGSLLVAKIYDIRFLNERIPIFHRCTGEQLYMPHPWSYE